MAYSVQLIFQIIHIQVHGNMHNYIDIEVSTKLHIFFEINEMYKEYFLRIYLM